MAAEKEIRLHVLGDFGPFSRAGKSIGYLVSIGEASFIVDCGSPLLNQIGGKGIQNLSGVIITHCHDDHKRWFTDLALYFMYASDSKKKLFLLSSEEVTSELRRSSSSAMNRTLSLDSSTIIDIPFEDFIVTQLLGPRALYTIEEIRSDETRMYGVVDWEGKELPHDRAKVVINPSSGIPRMLFKDPDYDEWIEPESFYPFSSSVFYEENSNTYTGDGFKIEAIKAPVWHGIPGIGLRFSTSTETLVFTSDTVHDTELWKRIAETKRTPKADITSREFLDARIVYGDINDYIERVWSRERYDQAMNSFDGAVVIQDVSVKGSIVHTDYEKLDNTNLDRNRTVLTHSPDSITSEWVLSYSDKSYVIRKGEVLEQAEGADFRLDADIYHKEDGKLFIGYKRERGAYAVYEKESVLSIHPAGEKPTPSAGKMLYRVDLYEDISGRYFPRLDTTDKSYIVRADGKVELVRHTDKGSSGQIVDSLRKPASDQ
jgi:ribonuclease BN (tRNA processing enzyme)